MIWLGAAVCVLISALVAWDRFKHWRDVRLFEKRLGEANERYERERASLPDGQRPLTPQEKIDAINRVRAAGRLARK